jgi:vancomycin permeability regulator SanA
MASMMRPSLMQAWVRLKMAVWRGRTAGWRRVLVALALIAAAVVAASLYVELRHGARIQTPEEIAPAPVALVFGAGLAKAGEPSPVLKQRLNMAIALYRAGKVKKVLVSGDNTDRYHDETKAMRRYVIDRGIPTADVVGDYAGVSTYDTCYRAREIFGVEQAILVTQEFHLPRALYIANGLGIDAWGVPADARARRVWRYELREFFARAHAVVQVLLRPQARVLGRKESMDDPVDGTGAANEQR